MTRVFERDRKLLLFVWHYRMCTTATLIKKFYPGTCVNVAYKRIAMLGRDGYIRQTVDRSIKKTFWTVTSQGMKVIRNHLPALSTTYTGGASPEHDHFTSSILLGPNFLDEKEIGVHAPESILRFYHKEFWPEWIPQNADHRSDGYYGAQHEGRILPIALEVEFSRKANADLDRAISFYNFEEKVVRVLWVVETAYIAKAMSNYISSKARANRGIHNFALIKDIEEKFWEAPIICGPEAGMKVENLFLFGAGKSVVNLSAAMAAAILFDFSKTATSLIAYKCSEKAEIASKGVGTPIPINTAPNISPVLTDSVKGTL